MIYLQLFFEFFKAGLFAVGGGLATLPFLYDMAARYSWFTETDLANMIAVSESTPGPIGVNMATYAGTQAAGIPGALVATGALVLPSVIIILIVAMMLQKFRQSVFVDSALQMLRPASVGLVAVAALSVLKESFLFLDNLVAGRWAEAISIPGAILYAVLLVLYRVKPKLHPIVFIGIGAATGIVLGALGCEF